MAYVPAFMTIVGILVLRAYISFLDLRTRMYLSISVRILTGCVDNVGEAKYGTQVSHRAPSFEALVDVHRLIPP